MANWSSGCMLKTSTGTLVLAFLIPRKTSNPLRPGIVMSSTTTSHFSFQTRARASCALRASPKSARRNSSAKICRKPRRTTAWSSTISIFIVAFLVIHGPAHRDSYHDGRAFAVDAANVDFAAEQGGPLAHTAQADRAGVGEFRLGNAAPVVPDFQQHGARLFFQMDLHARGVGVADHVGQRFLKDTEESGVQFRIQVRFFQGRLDMASDAGARLKIIGLPLDGCHQPKVIQDTRTQLGG